MGVCSYCLLYKSDECFGWGEARVCGISGPTDPIRVERQQARDKMKAARLRKEAEDLLQSANEKARELELELEADSLYQIAKVTK